MNTNTRLFKLQQRRSVLGYLTDSKKKEIAELELQQSKEETKTMTLQEMIEKYEEIEAPEATGRVLDGSSDHGYDEEWIGYGTICNSKVRAIYLIDYNEQDENPDMWDWELALKRFEEDIYSA